MTHSMADIKCHSLDVKCHTKIVFGKRLFNDFPAMGPLGSLIMKVPISITFKGCAPFEALEWNRIKVHFLYSPNANYIKQPFHRWGALPSDLWKMVQSIALRPPPPFLSLDELHNLKAPLALSFSFLDINKSFTHRTSLGSFPFVLCLTRQVLRFTLEPSHTF